MRNALILAAGAMLALSATPALAKHGNDRHDRDDRGSWNNSYRCPPGLAKKHNGCMAPGQARNYYNRSQRVPTTWRQVRYQQLPSNYRTRYSYNDGSRYYYDNNRVYRVDPTTHLIQSVISILR